MSFLLWSAELALGQGEPFISLSIEREGGHSDSLESWQTELSDRRYVLVAQPSEKDQACPSLHETDLQPPCLQSPCLRLPNAVFAGISHWTLL